MDAVEFFKEAKRMCRVIDCEECPFNKKDCGFISVDNLEEGVKAVEKWAAEHPVKTRQSKFLEMFPDARINDGVIDILPCTVNRTFEDTRCKRYKKCHDCSKNYWLAEVEDENKD